MIPDRYWPDIVWHRARPVLILDFSRDGYARVMQLDDPRIDDCGRTGYPITTVLYNEILTTTPWFSIFDIVAGMAVAGAKGNA